ncbi:MAG TPA: hypothetical protein VFQ76_12335, partial [Longimicrobiaceae bacterium]|nr:hypothetical protein [Longimicrobiaceae bacterium]
RYGYAYEGVQCHVQVQFQLGTVPLYRYWNAGIADHFYTINWLEMGSGLYGWVYEGIRCYVWPIGVTLTPSAGSPEAAGEPLAAASMSAEAMGEVEAVPEPVGAGVATLAGIPATFRMGVPAGAPAGEEADAPSFAGARQPAEEADTFTVPFPSALRRKNGNGGRSRPVTVSFTVGGEDEE